MTPHVFDELLEAMGRQDALGYLRLRCPAPMAPIELVNQMLRERRAVVSLLAKEPPGSRHTVAHHVEDFYGSVVAEGYHWVRDGLVWPWPEPEGRPGDVPRPLGMLRDSTHRILAELELKRLLPLLVERAATLTRARAAFIAIADPARGNLELIETRGLVGPVPRALEAGVAELEASLGGQPAAVVTRAGAPWLAPLLGDADDALVAPLWHQGEFLGALGCLGSAHNEAAADVLAMLADLTAIAIRNAAYYREIHHKAADLQAANERLRDLDRMKDLFLATVSHELRTPLNFITGFGSILMDGEEVAPLDEEQRYFMAKVMGGAGQLLGLVNDLLDYSRIRAGQLSLAVSPLNPTALLAEAAAEVAPLAATRGLEVALDVPGGLPEVKGDKHRLAQVLRNLLANALKFTPAGGHVTLAADVDRTHLRIEVRDDGVGIRPEQQHLLFERFSQLESASPQGGTGLGLAICKSLVEAHGGTVGVRSPLHPDKPYGQGAGSAFWFTLPL